MKKPAAKKPSSPKPVAKEKYVVVSFTVPPKLEKPMNAAAALRGFNRSAYLVWLIERDLKMHSNDLPEYDKPKVPSRIKRGQ